MTSILRVRNGDVSLQASDGAAPPLLFLHYAGGNEASLARLAARFEGRARLSPSYPGRCGSTGDPLATVEELADFARDVLDAAGVERCVAIGHSLGGAVAIELAIRHPARVEALVLLATGARLRVRPDILADLDARAKAGGSSDGAAFAFRADADRALVLEAAAVASRTPSLAAACDWAAADSFDRMRDLGSVRAPTLVVSGDEDALTPPKYAAYLAAHVPRAELVTLAGAGHMLPIERADEVAGVIEAFLARAAPGAP